MVVLGVSVDKDKSRPTSKFLQQAKLSFETSRDPEANISAEYGTFKYPETYVIDRDGKVLEKYIGPIRTGWSPRLHEEPRSALRQVEKSRHVERR